MKTYINPIQNTTVRLGLEQRSGQWRVIHIQPDGRRTETPAISRRDARGRRQIAALSLRQCGYISARTFYGTAITLGTTLGLVLHYIFS